MRREPLQARSPRLTPEERKRARGKRSLFLTGEASRASHWTRKLERARILRGIHDTYGIHQRFMRNTCRIRISGASGGMYRCHHRRSAFRRPLKRVRVAASHMRATVRRGGSHAKGVTSHRCTTLCNAPRGWPQRLRRFERWPRCRSDFLSSSAMGRFADTQEGLGVFDKVYTSARGRGRRGRKHAPSAPPGANPRPRRKPGNAVPERRHPASSR